ncbi:hypothetical protein GGS21DRAFT_400320 [Xylaria nigripes]|nr:hypothetical protein GGS21DRAFT_400320 [Xylaria nigripes]
MASTSTPLPIGDTSAPTSPQLTPRSKLKAMLAAVDDASSDDEIRGPIDAKSLFAAIDKNKRKLDLPRISQTDSADENDDEDTEIIRPRGRLAARMHANFTESEDTSKSHSGLSRRTPQDRTSPSSSERRNSPVGSSHEGAEDEDDVVLPSRRRLTVPDRESTPETVIPADRPESPSLFVSSPSPEIEEINSNPASPNSDEDEMPVDLSKSARFKALVEKKRKERLEKEAEEERRRMERAQRMGEQIPTDSDADDDVSDISDDDGGRKLTQDISRPARKASRKALEEMNRETQRLSRSLQLTHEVKTKKKISKASLFQRFNFRAEGNLAESENRQTGSSSPTTPGSVPQTDAEPETNGTPPSSLPTSPKVVVDQMSASASSKNVTSVLEDKNQHLLKLKAPLIQSNGHDEPEIQGDAIALPKGKQLTTKTLPRRFRVKLPVATPETEMVDFDEELEIANPVKKNKLDSVLARIPEHKAHESAEMKILRNLAHLSSPPREQVRGRNVKSSMTLGELQLSLQQRAKAQAKHEREQHLESLRARGIVVQSTEERQREEEQIEDIVSRARQEVEEIMLREKEEAKQNRKNQSQEVDPLAWDDSDNDNSYNGNEEEVEYSGSEDDEQEDNEEVTELGEEKVGDEEDQTANESLFVNEAEEVQSEHGGTPNSESDFSDDDIEAMKRSTARRPRRSKKNPQVISDDEDETGVDVTPRPKHILPKSPSALGSSSSKTPTSVLRSATKTFIPGLPIALAAPAGLGLTQIFAGTMDDSEAGSPNGSPTEFMPSIGQFPDSQFSATADKSQHDDMASESQPAHSSDSQARESLSQSQGIQLHYSQSQTHGFDSLIHEDSTQMFGFLEPTQDAGFQDFTPLKQRFIDPPQSTTSTVLLASTQDDVIIQESPLARKRGKLFRRIDFSDTISATQPDQAASVIDTDELSENKTASTDVFRLMKKAAKREKRLKKLNRKKSKANEMIEVQAEESEDEYAGLGGADGEDSSEEDEELNKQMIDDSGENEWDAAKLASVFGDRDRAADAAQVDKLFRDITTGMLRKRRRGGDGHEFDLSDSDDGGEARRRMKRRQFAKMQKALFADERIGKIAENPRTVAFLKSIEDVKDDDELDFGDNFVDTKSTSGDDSQSQDARHVDQSIPDSQPLNANRKRPHADDHGPRSNPNERRSREGVPPTSLVEVRRSLSTLLDENNASASSIISATDVGSDSDEEGRPSTSQTDKENHHPRRHAGSAVVDRITLKRNSSSSLSTGGTSANARLAFTASSTTTSGFKVPVLLRRATTNSTKLSSGSNLAASSTTSNTSQASTGSKSGLLNKAADFGDDGKLKKTAGKRSGVNYFAHENERRAKVADAEKRREAKKWKGAEGRSKVVGSLFGSGSFE